MLNQFKIQTIDGSVINGEYEGNKSSGKALIFSHGFGVERNSRGLFTELGDALKDKFLIVRFDYTTINKNESWTMVPSLNTQVKILEAVDQFIRKKFSPTEVDIIAHSFGCLTAGLVKLGKIKKVLLLAGPLSSPYTLMKEYFLKRPGSQINENSTSVVKRSDGSITYIEKDFWKETKVVNPLTIYENLSKRTKVTFIRAIADQVVVEKNYDCIKKIDSIEYREIECGHDFQNQGREELIKVVTDILT